MKKRFRIFAGKVSVWAGSPLVFVGAIFIILVWALSGPAFNYSDTWQLIINTGTTIITFLMVFLIQNTQNRDGKAVQLKLDELIRTNKMARDIFVSLEDITDEELQEIANEFKKIHESSAPPSSMRKLHLKIEQAHSKRKSIREVSEQMVGVVLDPFTSNHKKDS